MDETRNVARRRAQESNRERFVTWAFDVVPLDETVRVLTVTLPRADQHLLGLDGRFRDELFAQLRIGVVDFLDEETVLLLAALWGARRSQQWLLGWLLATTSPEDARQRVVGFDRLKAWPVAPERSERVGWGVSRLGAAPITEIRHPPERERLLSPRSFGELVGAAETMLLASDEFDVALYLCDDFQAVVAAGQDPTCSGFADLVRRGGATVAGYYAVVFPPAWGWRRELRLYVGDLGTEAALVDAVTRANREAAALRSPPARRRRARQATIDAFAAAVSRLADEPWPDRELGVEQLPSR